MADETTVAALRAEVAALRAELAMMRDAATGGRVERAERADRADRVATREPVSTEEARSGRRGFVKLAAGAAAGAVAAAVVSAEPAAAVTGGTLLVGQSNSPTSATDVTRIFNPSITALGPNLFMVSNYSSATLSPDVTWRSAVYGQTCGVDSGNGVRIGVTGEVRNFNDPNTRGVGVMGTANRANAFSMPTEPVGVLGVADAAGTGVKGWVFNGSNTIGVHGLAAGSIGVQAEATGAGGVGVNAVAPDTALAAQVNGRFRQITSASSGAPSFAATAGEQWRDSNGDLFICTVTGAPGTWRKVVAQHPAYANAGGSLNLLAAPIRILDTRGNGAPQTNGGAPLTANVDLAVSVTGVDVGGVSVPAGARGIFGTITSVAPDAVGNVGVYAADIAYPGTSNVNFRPGGATASAFTVALSAAGAVNVRASSGTHLLLDVTGFIF